MKDALCEESQACLVVAKAFLVVRLTPAVERTALKAVAEQAANSLQTSNVAESLRRAVFYLLIAAEVDRENDPIPARQNAFDVGERLEQLGGTNPFPLYMKMVEAITERITTAAFGDFKSAPIWSHSNWSQSMPVVSEQIQADCGRALKAVGLSDSEIDKYDTFLWKTSLNDLLRKHGVG